MPRPQARRLDGGCDFARQVGVVVDERHAITLAAALESPRDTGEVAQGARRGRELDAELERHRGGARGVRRGLDAERNDDFAERRLARRQREPARVLPVRLVDDPIEGVGRRSVRSKPRVPRREPPHFCVVDAADDRPGQ